MIDLSTQQQALSEQGAKARLRARHAWLVFNLMVGCGVLISAAAIGYLVYINLPHG